MRLSLEAERAGQSRSHYDRRAKGPDVWGRLLELTHDSDANVRHWVIETLGEGSPVKYRRAVIGKLMMLTDDCDGRVRRSAKQALDSYRNEAQMSFFSRATETIASKY